MNEKKYSFTVILCLAIVTLAIGFWAGWLLHPAPPATTIVANLSDPPRIVGAQTPVFLSGMSKEFIVGFQPVYAETTKTNHPILGITLERIKPGETGKVLIEKQK